MISKVFTESVCLLKLTSIIFAASNGVDTESTRSRILSELQSKFESGKMMVLKTYYHLVTSMGVIVYPILYYHKLHVMI